VAAAAAKEQKKVTTDTVAAVPFPGMISKLHFVLVTNFGFLSDTQHQSSLHLFNIKITAWL
jgi:hypothetical protein